MIKTVLAVLCLVLLAGAARADDAKLAEAGSDPLGAGMLPVVGMHDMEGHRWGVAVSPFLWKTKNIMPDGHCCSLTGGQVNTGDTLPSLSGAGGSLALSYEFTPHWGVMVFGGVARGNKEDLRVDEVSGLATTEAFAKTAGGAGFPGGAINNMNGTVVGAMGTWDPFDNPDGFRLPISLGVFQGYQSFDFDHAFANPNNGAAQVESVRFKRQFTGVVGAISLDFLLFHNVRLMPGVFIANGLAGNEADYDYRVQQNNGPTKQFHSTLSGTPMIGTGYISVAYRPWGVGYTLNLAPTAATVHALTWSHHFGPGRAAK